MIDLRNNSLGPKFISALVPLLKTATNVVGLDLSDNNIKEKGLVSILSVLPITVKRLVLDRNFSEKEEDDFPQAIASCVETRPALKYLSIAGCSSGRSKNLNPLFSVLSNNITLQELDITDNAIGDSGFSQLSYHLRSNETLKSLKCDLNNIGYSGYQCFRQMLNHNTTLENIEWPTNDLENQGKNNTKFRQLLSDIYAICAGRKKGNEDQIVEYSFEFDCKWKTPENAPRSLLEVPLDIQQDALEEINLDLDLESPVDDDMLFVSIGSQRSGRSSQRHDSSNSLPISPRDLDSEPEEDRVGLSRKVSRTKSFRKSLSQSKKKHSLASRSNLIRNASCQTLNDENKPNISSTSSLNDLPPPMDCPPPPSGVTQHTKSSVQSNESRNFAVEITNL
jgi:hypothetical protein